jgi:acyl-CoA thioester hydrolase
LILAFFPEGAPGEFPPRQPFPISPPPPGAFKILRTVRWEDIDALGHVNNAVYMDYVNEGGFQVCAAFHWPWQRMLEHGFTLVLRQTRLQYLQPAVLGDQLEITTWVSDVRRTTARRHFTLHRASDGILLAQAYTQAVWVDLNTHHPIRIPGQMLADFAPNIAGPGA